MLRAAGIGPLASHQITRALLLSASRPWLVDLSNNMMGDKGAQHFATLLEQDDTIVWLALSSNGMAMSGGVAIAQSLMVNRTLTALDLSSDSSGGRRNTIGRRTTKLTAVPPTWRAAPIAPAPSIEPEEESPLYRLTAAPAVEHFAPSAPASAPPAPAPPPPRAAAKGSHRAAPHRPPPRPPLAARRPPQRPGAVRKAAPPPPHRVEAGVGDDAIDDGPAEEEMGEESSDQMMWETSAEAMIALAASLSVNPILSILRLDGNSLGPDGVGILAPALQAESCALAELSLGHNGIGADGIEALATPVATSTSLRLLDLSANSIGDRGLRTLAQAFLESPPPASTAPPGIPPDDAAAAFGGLSELTLSRNGLSSDSAPYLARGLANRPHLCTLRLHRNELSNAGAITLAQALSLGAGCGLTDIVLSENGIGDDGAAAFGEALASAKCRLTRLDLAHNEVGERGGCALAAGLSAGGAPLQVLRLMWNKLPDGAGIALGHALGAARHLRSLHLQHNGLSQLAGAALTGGVEASAHLMQLGVEGNSLAYSTTIRIEELLAAKRKQERGSLSARTHGKVAELERTSRQLAAAKREHAALCHHRQKTEARVRNQAVEREGARRAEEERRAESAAAREAVKQRLQHAQAAAKQIKVDYEDRRQRWASALEARTRRRGLEDTRVKALQERFASDIADIGAAEAAARDQIAALDEQLVQTAARSDESEALLREANAQFELKRDEMLGRRIPLPHLPPKPTDDEILAMLLPVGWRQSSGEGQGHTPSAAGGGGDALEAAATSARLEAPRPTLDASSEASQPRARPSSARPAANGSEASKTARPGSAAAVRGKS